MGRTCSYETPQLISDGGDIGEKEVEHAVEALDRLIEKHPDLLAFQREIERRLRLAGPNEKRMAVISIMIESRLTDLARQMRGLLSLIA